MRPVLVMNINVLKSMKGTLDELTIANNFLSMYAIERVVYPGKAEAWTTIIDLDGVGLSEIPIKNIKGIISACQRNFRGRSFKIFIVNAGYTIRGSWYLVSKMIDDFTNNKISVMGDEYKQKLLEYIDPDCLEQRFGGTVPDLKGGYFPPNMEIPGQKMLTRQEFVSRVGLPMAQEMEYY